MNLFTSLSVLFSFAELKNEAEKNLFVVQKSKRFSFLSLSVLLDRKILANFLNPIGFCVFVQASNSLVPCDKTQLNLDTREQLVECRFVP